MNRRILSLVIALCVMGGPVAAQERPAPVQAFSIAETGRLGQAIWRQDVAAARATDALLAQSDGQAPQGLIGWIVTSEGDTQRVRFLAGEPDAPRAFKDVVVDAQLKAGAVVDAADPELSPDERAQFAARNTAAQAIGPLRCAARYNAVMLKDPEGEGWLVWLLASTTQANVVPMGGHYRFHVSADGKTVEKREQLSGGCLDMDRRQAQQGGQTVGLVTSILVAPQPLEVHVFLSLLNRLPIYAMAGDKLWEVQGARIREVTPPARR
ncbi:hypothetical protein EGY25_06215 [Brevundimonas intermedia]|uniref:META domain-containing protein n=1 Tax=Brevundimonas intermedia TaxID=74315 RepID=A0A4Y9S0L4_9CAUL|nr:hypothetical protein [Brevundimonas intermedia]TFW13525.1 hypothetical protein EGY25_06215 [Brevundimonas intermedia]